MHQSLKIRSVTVPKEPRESTDPGIQRNLRIQAAQVVPGEPKEPKDSKIRESPVTSGNM